MITEETWVCVDGHGDERIFPSCPYRNFPNMRLDVSWGRRWTTDSLDNTLTRGVLLPKGTIKFLTGKDMAYGDEPIKITIHS